MYDSSTKTWKGAAVTLDDDGFMTLDSNGCYIINDKGRFIHWTGVYTMDSEGSRFDAAGAWFGGEPEQEVTLADEETDDEGVELPERDRGGNRVLKTLCECTKQCFSGAARGACATPRRP